jgi:glycerol uptake facilitator-like aquaporin
MNQKLLKQCVAEFIGTFALIFVGVGAIYNLGSVPGGLRGIGTTTLSIGSARCWVARWPV